MKKCFYFLLVGLATAACCLLFAGCSRESEKSPDTLWIVTEKTTKDGMNGQAEHIIKAFEKAHEGITVELEILPEEGQEREIRLEKLRAAIMAGKEPDGFLLPLGTYQNEKIGTIFGSSEGRCDFASQNLFQVVHNTIQNIFLVFSL